MGSKYLGLMGFVLLAILPTLALLRTNWRSGLMRSVELSVPALIIAAPWYVKNLFWFGNPIYPLVFGGPRWDEQRLDLHMAYLNSFGVGRGLLEYLLLPWNIYSKHEQFGSVMNRIDIPSVLFPLILFFPIRNRHPAVRTLLWLAVGRFALWSLGSQQIRFLLPIYPALAIGAADLSSRPPGGKPAYFLLGRLFPALATGLMLIPLFYQIRIAAQFNPTKVAIGAESRRSYLSRIVKDYPAIRDFQRDCDESSRLLMLGDGRGYWCVPQCLPDLDHFRWARQIVNLENDAELCGWFAAQGATHILFSLEDLDSLLQHDPTSIMEKALLRVVAWRDSGKLYLVFADDWTETYLVTC